MMADNLKIIEPAEIDITAIYGNTVDPVITIALDSDPAFSMTGKTVNISVFPFYSDTVLYTFSSGGTSPKIVIDDTDISVDFDSVPKGRYRYFCDVTDGTDTDTMMRGILYVVDKTTGQYQ